MNTVTPGLTKPTCKEVRMAELSLRGGSLVNKPYVDHKLSMMLSGTLFGGRWDSWHVYLVYDRREYLRYAGQTGALFSRFSQHRASGRLGDRGFQQGDDWASVAAIRCLNEVQVKALERKLIHAFHPPDNRKCETPGCRYYLDALAPCAVTRGVVNKNLRGRGIEVR